MNRSHRHSQRILFVIIIALFLCNHARLIAQDTKGSSLGILSEAMYYVGLGQYHLAKPLFDQIQNNRHLKDLEEDVLFNTGLCYYHSEITKPESINYFERYLKLSEERYEVHYFLAKSYQYTHQLDKALHHYKIFKELAEDSPEDSEVRKLAENIDHDINTCNYGKFLMSNPVDVVVENLGPGINTSYSEYAPVIGHQETVLAFTRRSPVENKRISPDGDYFEDIYITNVLEGSLLNKTDQAKSALAGYFTLLKPFKSDEPKSIGNKVNTRSHDGAVQFKPDDKGLFIYHDADIWLTEFQDDEWQSPIRLDDMHEIANTNAHEPSVSIAMDEQTMIIVSDREGSKGGLDLYMSKKSRKGEWRKPKNMGRTINTKYDEDGPYLDPDGRTLYFSSKGHSSMGGYDVFKTQYDGDKWSEPQNMGYPINSAGDDIFYMMTPLFNRAYYSSNKVGGYGKMDIYRLTFADERKQLAEVKGLVRKGEEFVPAKSNISIYDETMEYNLYNITSDSSSGSYQLMFDHGKKYNMLVETEGFLPYQRLVEIPREVFYYEFYQEIHHVHLTDKEGNIIGESVEMVHASNIKESLKEKPIMGDSIVPIPVDTNKIKPVADVTFYISPDSLVTLLKDSAVNMEILPEEATVSFYKQEDTTVVTEERIVVDSVTISNVLQEMNWNYHKDVVVSSENTTEIKDLKSIIAETISLLAQLRKLPQDTVSLKLIDALDTAVNILNSYPKSEIVNNYAVQKHAYEQLQYVDEILGKLTLTEDADLELLEIIKSGIKNELALMSHNLERLERIEEELRQKELEELTDILYGAQKTMAKVQYSLSGLYDLVDYDSLRIQQKSVIDESSRLIDECRDNLKTAKHVLSIDSVRALSALASIGETDQLLVRTNDVIQTMEQNIEQNVSFNSEDKSNLKSLIAETEVSLIRSEIAIANTPEPMQSIDESYDQFTSSLIDIQGILDQFHEAVNDEKFEEVSTEDIKGEIIKVELALLKTLKMVEDNKMAKDSLLKAELLRAKEALNTINQDLTEIEHVKSTDAEMKAVIEELNKEIVKNEEILVLSATSFQIKEEIFVAEELKLDSFPKQFIIYFEFDQYDFGEEAKRILEQVKSLILKYSELGCSVTGHTDSKGSESYNKTLSKRRAERVVEIMRIAGIDIKINAEGIGEAQPIAPNILPDGSDNPAGREINRRVEINLFRL